MESDKVSDSIKSTNTLRGRKYCSVSKLATSNFVNTSVHEPKQVCCLHRQISPTWTSRRHGYIMAKTTSARLSDVVAGGQYMQVFKWELHFSSHADCPTFFSLQAPSPCSHSETFMKICRELKSLAPGHTDRRKLESNPQLSACKTTTLPTSHVGWKLQFVSLLL